MALHWDVSGIADYKNVTTSPANMDEWHPVTHALVMHSMVLGYGHITTDNYKKIARRWAQYQLALDPVLGYQLMPKVYITEADVHMHIGLKVNVAWITDVQWGKKLVSMIDRDCASILRGDRNRHLLPEALLREDDLAVSAHEIVDRMTEHYRKEKVSGQDNS